MKPYFLLRRADSALNTASSAQEYEGAAAKHQKLINEHPDFVEKNPQIRLQLGKAYDLAGNPYRASAVFNQLLAQNPVENIPLDQRLAIGGNLANTGNAYQAVKVLESIPADYFDNSREMEGLYLMNLAQAHFESADFDGKYDEAMRYVDEIIATQGSQTLEAKTANLIAYMIFVQIGIGGDAAEEQADQALAQAFFQSAPEEMSAFYVRFITRLTIRRLTIRDEFAERLINSFDPESKDDNFWNAVQATELANWYADRGNYEQAERFFNLAVAEYPDYLQAYSDWGYMYAYRQGYGFKAALPYYEKALAIDPLYPTTNNLMGWAIAELTRTGNRDRADYDLALGYLQKAVAMNPKHSRAYNTMGYIYMEKEEYEKAIEHFNLARKYEEYSKPYRNLGDVYKKLGDEEKAAYYYGKAAEF